MFSHDIEKVFTQHSATIHVLQHKKLFAGAEWDFSLSENWLDTQQIKPKEEKKHFFQYKLKLSHSISDQTQNILSH